MGRFLKERFQLDDHHSTVKRELVAGLTGYVTIVYIVAVNAAILADAGIPMQAGVMATILIAFISCMLIGLWSNTPILLVPGMGINVLFVYTFVQEMGLSWQTALGVVAVTGIVFVMITFSRLAVILEKTVPDSLKEAITVGIGLFLTLIGLQKGGLVVHNTVTLLALGDFKQPEVWVTLATLGLMLFLYVRHVPGSLLITIIVGTVLGAIFGIVNTHHVSGFSFAKYGDVFGALSFDGWLTLPFWMAAFSLSMVTVFENFGLINSQIRLIDGSDRSARALKAISLSVLASSVIGTSPTVATAETAAGIAVGGRTGLTSVTTGGLFLLTLAVTPFVQLVPNSAIAPVLILVGGLMLQNIKNISLDDFTEAFPAYLTLAFIPLTSSIPDGMAFGFASYPLLKMFAGKARQLPFSLYLISALFFIYLVLHVVV